MGDNSIPIVAKTGAGFKIYYLSEQAVTIEFGNSISGDTQQQVSRFNDLVKQQPFPGFYTTVPAYTTLSVFFDPVQVFNSPLRGRDCFAKVSAYLSQLNELPFETIAPTNEAITIPVCYGGAFGHDLDDVARLHNLTTQEVINLHSRGVYQVHMIGFVPGFAYLGGMDERLETPRKTTPAAAVPAGSVGIAGMQTGIYPLETPGGWQIIGRTPLMLFDAGRSQPSLLKAGNKVVFEPIEHHGFNQIKNK